MLSQIENAIPTLSKAEQRVARWLIAHPRVAASATLNEVARACGASEPTVIRFCRHIGLDGFRDMTLRLTEALSQPVNFVHRDVEPGDSTSEAIGKVIDASVHALMETRAALARMPVDDAVSRMAKARQLVFVGLGASGHVAADASHKYFRLGIPSSSITDGPGMLQLAAVATTGDVLVFVSTTGKWTEMVDAATTAKQRGATVIALTTEQSPLAGAASLLMPVSATEDTGVYTPMSSRLAQLAILDALQVALALTLGEKAMNNLRASKSALSNRRDS